MGDSSFRGHGLHFWPLQERKVPWQECNRMDERLRFVARLLEGEKMAPLCREFDISRKTGYKLFERYKDFGLVALTDRSRRPYRHANQLAYPIEQQILAFKREYPSWGAPKIRELLRRQYPEVQCPAISTVHAVLDRHGLVKRRRRRRNRATGTPLTWPARPNDLWCADYKGEFMLRDRRYCYPLTVTDFASRYLFSCEALDSTKERYAFPVFERLFKDFGLPQTIRTDNGVPFASPNALFSLSRLAVWWLRHPNRAHQARMPPAERPPRAHASHAQTGSDQTRLRQFLAAASPLRPFRRRL
jgi:putative transposase